MKRAGGLFINYSCSATVGMTVKTNTFKGAILRGGVHNGSIKAMGVNNVKVLRTVPVGPKVPA